MSRSSTRYAVIAFATISTNLLFYPIEAFAKPRLEVPPCESVTLPSLILTRQARNECGDRKPRRVTVRTIDDNKNELINDDTPSSGGSSGGGSSGGGGTELPLPPEVPGRLIVEQMISVTFRMSLVGFSFGNPHAHSHDATNHFGIGNTLSAADLTYGIGVGVATNGQSTLLAIGGAFAGTVATTNMTQARATSSGQGLGITYSFLSPLPTPAAGEVIKISQMVSVVVTNTIPVSSPAWPNGGHHEKREKSIQQANADKNNKASAAPLVAVDQAVLNAGATLSQNSFDALVSAVVLTGSTTIITGTGVTPVTAHAAGVAGGAALTIGPTSVSTTSTPASSSTKTPVEINQTLSVAAETIISPPVKTPHNHDSQPLITALPAQTVDLTAITSQAPASSKGVANIPATAMPVAAETKAGGSGATATQADSSPSAPTNPSEVSDAPTAVPKHDHQARLEKRGETPKTSEDIHAKKAEQRAGTDDNTEKKKTSVPDLAQQQPKEPYSKDQSHDSKKNQPNGDAAESGQKSAAKTQDVTTPKTQDVTPQKTKDVTVPVSANAMPSSSPQPAPASPSTAQASANGAGSAAVASGTLAAGAGAQAQSGAQSTGASQSSPAEAAASGSSVAGAGSSSTTPTQSAAANGVSLASTGATLQTSP